MSVTQLPTPLRGGLLFLLALLALLLAAGLASAQPPHGHSGKPEHPEDLGPHGDFARRGEEASRDAMEPADLENAPRVLWRNPEGGSWNDPANWSGGAVPGEGDVAVLDLEGTYTVTLEEDAIIAALVMEAGEGTRTLLTRRPTIKIRGASRVGSGQVLHLDGGIVTGPGDLEIEGTLRWSAGSMSGTGTARIAASGRLTIEGAKRKVLSLRSLENAGEAEWRDTGNWVLTFSATVRNAPGGRFVLAADALLDLYGPEGPSVINAGRLHKVSGGTLVSEVPFTNAGRVEVEEGVLELLAGARYLQTGGVTTVAAGASIRSQEALQIEGGTVSGEGAYPQPAKPSASGSASDPEHH